MRLFVRILWTMALCFVCFGCDDILNGDHSSSGTPQDPMVEYEFQEGVKYYEDSLSSYISLVNDTTMFIAADMPSEKQPEIGNVIFCPCTSSTPYGFLRRVTSIESVTDGLTIYTEEATLEDAFYTLKFNQQINLADHIKELRDSLGNEVPFELVTDAIWDKLNPEDTTSLDDIETKSALESDISQSFKLPIASRTFEGSVFMDIDLHVKLDIGFGKLNEFSYTMEKKVGLCGKAHLSTSEIGEEYEDNLWSHSLVNKNLPFATPIGPAFLQFFPNITFDLSIVANADISLGAELRYIFEHSQTDYSYVNGEESHSVTNLMDKNENYMTLVTLEASGEFGVKGTAGLELRLWNGDVFAFGGEAGGKLALQTEGEISMSNKSLLLEGQGITVSPSLFLTIYVESWFIKKRNHRMESTSETKFDKFKLRLLPEMEAETSTEEDKFIVQPTVKPVSMMRTTEEGFALFSFDDHEQPIQHVELPEAVVSDVLPPSDASDNRTLDKEITTKPVEFNLPSSEKSYFVKSYVVAGGNHYYGDAVYDLWIDLGLSVLWAKYNVGATSPEEYGGYYAWGETEEKGIYDRNHYQYIEPPHDPDTAWVWTNIGDCISGTIYDVATVQWGGGARMPTIEEIEELIAGCEWDGGNVNGVAGNYLTGPNGNSIFIPFSSASTNLDCSDAFGGYWTGTLSRWNDSACVFICRERGLMDSMWRRNIGMAVRPVKNK